VLEGRFGFYQAFCGGQFHEAELLDRLGEYWCIPDVFYKPYPANHFTHAGIDAALRLRERFRTEGVALDEIAEIELGVASPTLRTIAQPPEAKARPHSGYHAQFSGPFTVAAALLGEGGGLGLWLDDFTDARVQDERYLALAAKVRCVADPECDAIFPNQFPAVLKLRLRDGREFCEKVLANRGGPGNPLSTEELKLKFSVNAQRCLSAEAADALAAAIMKLEEANLSALLRQTIPPQA
jgi:2-methylcitrate dehydratase PrpD